MALYYLKSRDPIYKMCPLFGAVPTSAYVWLDFSMEVLLRVVQNPSNTDFEIRWPSIDEMEASSAPLMRNRENGHLLKSCFAVLDGARMPCATYGDPTLNNAYWEGFTQAQEVSNLFVWNFFGEIVHAGVNFPGSWHDSRVAAASGLYFTRLSDRITPPGFCILGDSAFPRSTDVNNGKILRARKVNEMGSASGVPESAFLAAVDLLLDRAMPSERQSAEWGVRAVKGPFKRITVPLPSSAYTRFRIISTVAHLYNFRTRMVGLNQIQTVYADRGTNVQQWVREEFLAKEDTDCI